MPKFYVISDVHGFYNEMREALNNAGFDPNNEEHWLVSLGDEMDRGPDPEKVINYLMRLPRAIFVKGNHQQLMEDMCERRYAEKHDWSNGTMQSVLDLAPDAKTADEAFEVAYSKIKPFFDKTVNYLELKNHILVHAWIPLIDKDDLPPYYVLNRHFEFNPDWRNASDYEWDDARWGNPFMFAEQGFLPDKTLVFGHWHCSEGWAIAEDRNVFGEDAKFDPFYGNGFIAIDACTAHSGKVNCIVIEDDFMESDVD